MQERVLLFFSMADVKSTAAPFSEMRKFEYVEPEGMVKLMPLPAEVARTIPVSFPIFILHCGGYFGFEFFPPTVPAMAGETVVISNVVSVPPVPMGQVQRPMRRLSGSVA